MNHRLLMILSYGLLTMPILLVCFFGIAQIRKRSTIKSVRLTATLGLGLIGIIALFSLAYNANFDIIVGELTMNFGIEAFSFFTAIFNSVSNFFFCNSHCFVDYRDCVEGKIH